MEEKIYIVYQGRKYEATSPLLCSNIKDAIQDTLLDIYPQVVEVKCCENCSKFHKYCDVGMAHCKANNMSGFELSNGGSANE